MERYPLETQARHLPAPIESGSLLVNGETLAVGMQRLSLAQLDTAIGQLRSGNDVDLAVHEARKAMKKLRALLRLVRSEIGERVYHYENAVLRDGARVLAPLRDGSVAVATVTRLGDRFDGLIASHVFGEMEERLRARASRLRHRVLDEGVAVDSMVGALVGARRRFAGWPTDEDGAKAYGSAIRHRFGSVGPGLERTYERGRREMAAAYRTPSAHRFHQWRKRVKYLRHQTQILAPLWPELLGGMAATLDRLGAVLGDEHDLAHLLQLMAVDPELCPDPVERSLFAALAQHRRVELQQAARVLGTRIYAEKAPAFRRRLGAYWESNALESRAGTLTVI